MAWFVVRDAFGEVLEVTPCSGSPAAQQRRIIMAVRSWKRRGDTAHQLGELEYRMTSFDGNVRVLSIESRAPNLARGSDAKSSRGAAHQQRHHQQRRPG